MTAVSSYKVFFFSFADILLDCFFFFLPLNDTCITISTASLLCILDNAIFFTYNNTASL